MVSVLFWLDSSRRFPVTETVLVSIIAIFVLDLWVLRGLLGLAPRFSVFTVFQVVTASLLERNLVKLVLAIFFTVKFLIPVESLWGSASLAKYLLYVLVPSNVGELLLEQIFVRSAKPYYGCGPVLIAISIAHRHAFPLTPIAPSLNEIIPKRIFQSRHLPFLLMLAEIVGRWTFPGAFTEAQVSVFAFGLAWLHIRYFQFFPFAQVQGDHSEEFALAMLFPRWTRKLIGRVCASVYGIVSENFPTFKLRSYSPGGADGRFYAQEHTDEAEKVGNSLEDRAAWESRRQRALRFLDAKENTNRTETNTLV